MKNKVCIHIISLRDTKSNVWYPMCLGCSAAERYNRTLLEVNDLVSVIAMCVENVLLRIADFFFNKRVVVDKWHLYCPPKKPRFAFGFDSPQPISTSIPSSTSTPLPINNAKTT